jgi:hypothetical protein
LRVRSAVVVVRSRSIAKPLHAGRVGEVSSTAFTISNVGTGDGVMLGTGVGEKRGVHVGGKVARISSVGVGISGGGGVTVGTGGDVGVGGGSVG